VHRFDKAPVITAAAARVRGFAQTMRLHLRPLGVGQYESFHPKLESQLAIRWNPESQQTLASHCALFENPVSEIFDDRLQRRKSIG
jgi:hypothetical protein